MTDEDFQSQLSGILGEETPDGVISKKLIKQMQDDLKNFGFNVGAGTLEALALQVEGSANIVDETVNRFRELIDKEPTRFLRDATGQIVADLDAGSESLRNKITSDMKIRQLEALPAVGMPFGTALPGGEQALDRAGNPYGTDKWATFLNASEEFGDVFIDMAITAIPCRSCANPSSWYS